MGSGAAGGSRAHAPAFHHLIEQRRNLTDRVVAGRPPTAVDALAARRVAEPGLVRPRAGGACSTRGADTAGAFPAWAETAFGEALRRDDDVAVRTSVLVPAGLGLVRHAPAVQRQE